MNSWNSMPPETVDTPFMQAFKSRFNTTGEDEKFLHRVLPTHAVTSVLKVRIALAGKNQITAFNK